MEIAYAAQAHVLGPAMLALVLEAADVVAVSTAGHLPVARWQTPLRVLCGAAAWLGAWLISERGEAVALECFFDEQLPPRTARGALAGRVLDSALLTHLASGGSWPQRVVERLLVAPLLIAVAPRATDWLLGSGSGCGDAAAGALAEAALAESHVAPEALLRWRPLVLERLADAFEAQERKALMGGGGNSRLQKAAASLAHLRDRLGNAATEPMLWRSVLAASMLERSDGLHAEWQADELAKLMVAGSSARFRLLRDAFFARLGDATARELLDRDVVCRASRHALDTPEVVLSVFRVLRDSSAPFGAATAELLVALARAGERQFELDEESVAQVILALPPQVPAGDAPAAARSMAQCALVCSPRLRTALRASLLRILRAAPRTEELSQAELDVADAIACALSPHRELASKVVRWEMRMPGSGEPAPKRLRLRALRNVITIERVERAAVDEHDLDARLVAAVELALQLLHEHEPFAAALATAVTRELHLTLDEMPHALGDARGGMCALLFAIACCAEERAVERSAVLADSIARAARALQAPHLLAGAEERVSRARTRFFFSARVLRLTQSQSRAYSGALATHRHRGRVTSARGALAAAARRRRRGAAASPRARAGGG
jgi:hypothetical protein